MNKYIFITSSIITKKNFNVIFLYHIDLCNYFVKISEVSIFDIDIDEDNDNTININQCIIVDSILLLKDFFNEKLISFLKNTKKEKILLLHDMHNYSYDNCYMNNYFKIHNKKYNNTSCMISHFQIKKIISLYKCYECDEIIEDCKKMNYECEFYLINFHYSRETFKIWDTKKNNDILLYGSTELVSYPFRNRLLNIIRNKNKNRNISFYQNKNNYKNMICGSDLSKKICKSWITIATVSKYNYFVRKYMEIVASGSCIAGNINSQGAKIIGGSNIIYLCEKYDDRFISEKINFYLDNKILITEKINNGIKKIEKYDYAEYCQKVLNINENYKYEIGNEFLIISQTKSKYKFELYSDFFDYSDINNLNNLKKSYDLYIIEINEYFYLNQEKYIYNDKTIFYITYFNEKIYDIIEKYNIKYIISDFELKEAHFICYKIDEYSDEFKEPQIFLYSYDEHKLKIFDICCEIHKNIK